MTTILQLNTSLFGAGSQSSRLASDFVDALRRASPGGSGITVLRRDLAELAA